LYFNALQFGKQLAQLAVAYQRFSADDGNVGQYRRTRASTIYQLRTAIIGELAQGSIPEVLRLVCITAGTNVEDTLW
jgi:hypothetical protein